MSFERGGLIMSKCMPIPIFVSVFLIGPAAASPMISAGRVVISHSAWGLWSSILLAGIGLVLVRWLMRQEPT